MGTAIDMIDMTTKTNSLTNVEYNFAYNFAQKSIDFELTDLIFHRLIQKNIEMKINRNE